MSRHRVTLEFDLELSDEGAARDLAVELIRDQIAKTGGGVESSIGSPEVASYELGQELKVAATMVATEIARRGLSQMPAWITASKVNVKNEQLP
jgi:hypothetical protein